MKPYEYNDILTGLITSVSGLKERRPSAGRGLLMESLLADTVELTESLKTEVLVRVSREIWLEADEGIDYAALAEDLQNVLPIELLKAKTDEEEACERLYEALEALVKTLFDIAKALNRRYKNEDYIKLYEDELKLFVKHNGRYWAEWDFNQFQEKVGIGSLLMEDLEEYRIEKLQHMFASGVFQELVAHRQKAPGYPNEIAFHDLDDGIQVSMKVVHIYYYFLRKICDWEDDGLEMVPEKVGVPDSRRGILEWLAEMVGYGEWLPPATAEKILEMLHNALGVGMYELTGDEAAMSETFWSTLEQVGNQRVVWQNLIGYFAEHRFFSPNLGAPALNEMFFDTTEYYQNIDKGRPSYQRKAKKWARIQPLLDRFVPRKE